MSKENNKNKNPDAPKPVVARNPSDIQRLKLDKLMKNPDKLVIIPEKPKERGAPVVPDFVRNVMGSSAGAGSGEFHVYRHLRRKEYARQHYMTEKARWEKMEDDYHDKILENKRKAEEETAKKRAKRLKKKQNAKKKGGQKPQAPVPASSSSESDNEDDKEEVSTSAQEGDKGNEQLGLHKAKNDVENDEKCETNIKKDMPLEDSQKSEVSSGSETNKTSEKFDSEEVTNNEENLNSDKVIKDKDNSDYVQNNEQACCNNTKNDLKKNIL